MLIIENSQFEVGINEMGAQITHFIQKIDNFDWIWNGSEWPEHSPILFPAVGKSQNNQYVVDGKKYTMPINGFANNYQWTVVDKGDDRVSLMLMDNEETQKIYPFKFSLMVTYALVATGLEISFHLKNMSTSPMPYALGIMPAFNLSVSNEKLNFDDYELKFMPETPSLTQFKLNKEGLRAAQPTQLLGLNNSTLPLSKAVFDYGRLYINAPGLTSVILVTQKYNIERKITIRLEEFSGIEIWKSPKTDQFLAIAPINGFPDLEENNPSWSEKLGNKILEPDQEIDIKTTISLN